MTCNGDLWNVRVLSFSQLYLWIFFSLTSTLILCCLRHLSHFHSRVPVCNSLYEFISCNFITKANGTSDADFKFPVFYRHIFQNISILRTSWIFYLEIFANKFPIFPTRLTGLQHCTGYKVRRCQKKVNVKCVSFSCLIMYNTRQYISRTPSDRSRETLHLDG